MQQLILPGFEEIMSDKISDPKSHPNNTSSCVNGRDEPFYYQLVLPGFEELLTTELELAFS